MEKKLRGFQHPFGFNVESGTCAKSAATLQTLISQLVSLDIPLEAKFIRLAHYQSPGALDQCNRLDDDCRNAFVRRTAGLAMTSFGVILGRCQRNRVSFGTVSTSPLGCEPATG